MRSAFIFTTCSDVAQLSNDLRNAGFSESAPGVFTYASQDREIIWAYIASDIPELSAIERAELQRAGAGSFLNVIGFDISGRLSELDVARELIRQVACRQESVLMDDFSDIVWRREDICDRHKNGRGFLEPPLTGNN